MPFCQLSCFIIQGHRCRLSMHDWVSCMSRQQLFISHVYHMQLSKDSPSLPSSVPPRNGPIRSWAWPLMDRCMQATRLSTVHHKPQKGLHHQQPAV